MSKREQVVEAARNLFMSYGYKRVSMDEISRKSGVTKKTIYTYFNDKDDLLKHFVLEKVADIKRIVQDLAQGDQPIEEKTHQIIYQVLTYQKNDDLLKQLKLEADDAPTGNAKKWNDFVNDVVLKEIQAILKDAIKKGLIKDCDTKLLAFAIYQLYSGVVFDYDGKIGKKQITEIADFVNYGLVRRTK